jgi:ketosteroid isomerase-like protein
VPIEVNMNPWLPVAIALGFLGPPGAAGQVEPPAKENPVHDELRALKRGAEEAFNKGDIDGLLNQYVHKDVIVTWQNAEANHGRDAVKGFYNRMMVGPNRVVERVESKINVDELSHLFGSDTATALGDMDQHYKLTDGTEFDLHSRWTGTLVKDGDRWKIAAFHVSANMFDNGVMHVTVRKTAYWVGGVAGIAALLVGVVVGRLTKGSRAV